MAREVTCEILLAVVIFCFSPLVLAVGVIGIGILIFVLAIGTTIAIIWSLEPAPFFMAVGYSLALAAVVCGFLLLVWQCLRWPG